jgi:DNA-binding beta-propeller fold protein YncE
MRVARFYVLSSVVLILVLSIPGSSSGYEVLRSFSGYGPGGLAFDEATDTLWVSDMMGQSILQLNSFDGSELNSLDVSGYNAQPTGLSYYDGSLWNSDQTDSIIYEVNTASGDYTAQLSGQGGLTFEGGYLWRGPDWDSTVLLKIDPLTGSTVDTIDLALDPITSFISGLAFDSNSGTLWVADSRNNNLLNVALDGTILSTTEFSPSGFTGYEAGGLAFDDVNNTLWVNYADFSLGPVPNAKIYELSMTTVIPEPVSSILFIVGGATLGFRRFWRKQRTV